MALDMKLIERIDEKKRHNRLMIQHAKALMHALQIPESNTIASLLDPSRPCSNQEAIAYWVSEILKESPKSEHVLSIDELIIRLQEHLRDRQEMAS